MPEGISWFPHFLLLFAGGSLGAAQLAPARQIGGYFHRFMATVAFGLSATALAIQRSPEPLLAASVGVSIWAWVVGRLSAEARLPRLLLWGLLGGLALAYALLRPAGG